MRLVARNGPLAGGVLTLADGADTGCDRRRARRSAQVPDPPARVVSWSRHSAADASVFVNGLPVTTLAPVPIEPRDELRIGDSLFVVRADEPAPAPGLTPCAVEMRLAAPPRSLFQLGFDEALLAGRCPGHHARRPRSRDADARGRCAQLDSRAGCLRCRARRPCPGCGSGLACRVVGRTSGAARLFAPRGARRAWLSNRLSSRRRTARARRARTHGARHRARRSPGRSSRR